MAELRDTEVVSLQELAGRFAEDLVAAGPLSWDAGPQWADVGWLAHDLEDWGLLSLHHALVRPLTTASRHEHPYVAGVSLTQRGEAVLRLLSGEQAPAVTGSELR